MTSRIEIHAAILTPLESRIYCKHGLTLTNLP